MNSVLRYSKNMIAKQFGLLRLSNITFVLTDECNLRCRICDIWEKQRGQRSNLKIEKIREILASKYTKKVRYIAFTGGEPFLREDVFEIFSLVRSLRPDCKIVISSNGTLADKVVSFFRKIESLRNITLELSILGIESHDYLTDTKGAFETIQFSIEKLKQEFPLLRLRVKFTITPWNYLEMNEVVKYCSRYNLPVFIKIIENVKSHTNSIKYQDNFKKNSFNFSQEQRQSIVCALESIKNNYLYNRGIIKGIAYHLRGKQIKRRCYAAARSLFINPDGSVYRCRMCEPIGNINTQEFDGMIEGSQGQIKRLNGRHDLCKNCISIFRFLF
ncbi:MAG: radical SAM/SPASM domain-containing protein [Candidatus Omnitrophota bacterium]